LRAAFVEAIRARAAARIELDRRAPVWDDLREFQIARQEVHP